MSDRFVELTGAENFRDFGGYPTVDGYRVRAKTLYRSGCLAYLDAEDLERIAALDLRVIVDLRGEPERQRAPTRMPAEGLARCLELAIYNPGLSQAANGTEPLGPRQMERLFERIWRTTASESTQQIGTLVRELATHADGAVLIHCTAGRDRTGFACAVLLRLLGVNYTWVERDYLLSNHVSCRPGSSASWPESVRPAVLRQGFAEIARLHGSFERYVSVGLGLTDEILQKLRDRFLEAPSMSREGDLAAGRRR